MPLLCPGGGFIVLFVKKNQNHQAPKQKQFQSFVILEVISQVRNTTETTDLGEFNTSSWRRALLPETSLGRRRETQTKDELKFGGRLRWKEKMKG